MRSSNKGGVLLKGDILEALGKEEEEPLSNEATEGKSSGCLLRQRSRLHIPIILDPRSGNPVLYFAFAIN